MRIKVKSIKQTGEYVLNFIANKIFIDFVVSENAFFSALLECMKIYKNTNFFLT